MTPTPQLSLSLPTFAAQDPGDWSALLNAGRLLDECGVDRLLVSDHVVFGEALDDYGRPELGGVSGGVQPTGPDGHWLEPLTTLAVLAGTSTRIRLGTNILLAALRRPVVLAKAAATLDVLSDGRLDLGVGVGWQRAEYDAAGLDFSHRGRLLDESLQICRSLWTMGVADFETGGTAVQGIHMMPKPLQAGGVPIWVSGTVNPRVVRRIAEFGTGWIPWGGAAAEVVEGIALMREALSRIGHDPSELQIAAGISVVKDERKDVDVARTMRQVPPLIEAGVTDVRLALRIPAELSSARDLVSALVAEFRKSMGHPPMRS